MHDYLFRCSACVCVCICVDTNYCHHFRMRTFFWDSWKVDLLSRNSLNFCLFWKVIILPSLWKIIFSEIRFLTEKFVFLLAIWVCYVINFFHCSWWEIEIILTGIPTYVTNCYYLAVFMIVMSLSLKDLFIFIQLGHYWAFFGV